MFIFTSDRLTKSQLSLLLRELGHTPKFFEEITELCTALTTSQPQTLVFVDLLQEISDRDLDTIRSYDSELRIIGFERFDKSTDQQKRLPVSTFSSSIIIPNNAERAKFRLKNTLRGGSGGLKSTTTRPPFKTKKPFLTRPPFKSSIRASSSPFSKKENSVPPQAPSLIARYMTVESAASIKLFEKLNAAKKHEGCIILDATEDVEFEIVAREFNSLSNGDNPALYILHPDDIRIDYLEKLERKANTLKTQINCYLGRTDDLDEVATRELKLFLDFLLNLKNPHVRLILGHEIGTETLYRIGVSEHLSSIENKAKRISIPSLENRQGDIPTICQLTLSHLRTSHPFLLVKRISLEAEQFLIERRHDYSYTKLVRILRNAVALSKRTTLTVEDIKNYGESDITTQHLLETMADEVYFPQSANF